MLTSKVLYFPYIRMPQSAWLIRMLLYWDEVGTITPYEFVQEPERHEQRTLRLIQEGLVRQIIPSWYLSYIPNFDSAFLEYLKGLGPKRLAARRAEFADDRGFLVHAEKLDLLSYELADAGLARSGQEPWVEVERETARDFMAYLAATLGRVPDLGYAPITDEERQLSDFVVASSPSSAVGRLESLRLGVLDDLFPAPTGPVSVNQLARFKEQHGDELARFRRRVEQELVLAADMSDGTLRRQRLELFVAEAREEITGIRTHMAEAGWLGLVFGKLTAILAAVPGASPIFGLANAVYSAVAGGAQPDPRSPFLYACQAQRILHTEGGVA